MKIQGYEKTNQFILSALFILVLIFQTGCTTASTTQNTPTDENILSEIATSLPTPPQTEPTLTPTVEPIGEPTTAVIEPVLPEYDLSVRFDYPSQSAEIDQTIRYTNNAIIDLNNIKLSVDTLRFPGSFSLTSASANGEVVTTTEEDYYLLLELNEPLSPGNEIEIQISYTLKVPPLPPPADDKKPGIFGYSTIQTNFVDWYPFIPPLDQDGNWILHEPWFYGEYLVYDLANFHIDIELLNIIPNTTIAASTIPFQQVDNLYTYDSQEARNFVWSVSPSFVVEKTEVNGIIVSTYTFPFHQQAGSHVLAEAAKAIELYSQLFASYPRENLTIVEGDFLDGMEYDSLFFLGKGYYNLFDYSPQNYLTFIAAHETAHQWWYASVANDQAIEPWLDEALCTYSEVLFYENYYPELVNWWWEYRVNFYQPEGFINNEIYEYNGFIPYRNATYLQGAKFLQAVREDIGDTAFYELLKEYASTQQNLISSENYFLQLIDKYSGENPFTKYPEFLENRN